MEMIESVARALCRTDGHPENTKFEGKPMWASYSGTARVAIEAMRKPSGELLESIERCSRVADWQDMIDAALTAPPQT